MILDLPDEGDYAAAKLKVYATEIREWLPSSMRSKSVKLLRHAVHRCGTGKISRNTVVRMRLGAINQQVLDADGLFKRILSAEEYNSILFMRKYKKELAIDDARMESGFESQMKKGEVEPLAMFAQFIERIPEIKGFKACLRRASGRKYLVLEVQGVLQAFAIWKTFEEFMNQVNISAGH